MKQTLCYSRKKGKQTVVSYIRVWRFVDSSNHTFLLCSGTGAINLTSARGLYDLYINIWGFFGHLLKQDAVIFLGGQSVLKIFLYWTLENCSLSVLFICFSNKLDSPSSQINHVSGIYGYIWTTKKHSVKISERKPQKWTLKHFVTIHPPQPPHRALLHCGIVKLLPVLELNVPVNVHHDCKLVAYEHWRQGCKIFCSMFRLRRTKCNKERYLT